MDSLDPDPDALFWQLTLQIILIAVNAVFACAEIAVISINDAKLERLSATGNKRAQRLMSLTVQPAKFLATIQVGITLAGFLGSAFAADNFSDKLVNLLTGLGVTLDPDSLNTISVIVITIVLSFLTLVLGELVPKRIAMRKAEAIGLAMSGLVFVVSKVFAPLVWLLTKSTNGLLRLFRIDPNANDEEVTEEEIRMMVDVGSESGSIDENEKEFIHNVFEFDDKTAADLMTHRTEVTVLWIEDSDEIWEDTIIAGRHSTYPVCGVTADDVIGIVSAKEYLRLKDRSRFNVMKNTVKPAQFVPETVRADRLFSIMKKTRNHFAIVMDDKGGMSGVVAISDLLEELVGDLDDEKNPPAEPPKIEPVDGNTWRVSGSASLQTVSKTIGVSLPIDEYDSFGGMVFSLLGTIPTDGSTPELEEYGLVIKVTDIKEHRLLSSLVCKSDNSSKA